MLLVRSNRYETFVRTIFLKLCQKDNLLQSRETLKLLLIKVNFTFSGSQQLLICLKIMKLCQITVMIKSLWNLEHFFLPFVRIFICMKSRQTLKLG